MPDKTAYIVGTFDTKSTELNFLGQCLQQAGQQIVRVNVGTGTGTGTGDDISADNFDISAAEVARHHPEGESHVMQQTDRGDAIAAMSVALEQFLSKQPTVDGVIGAGGSGGTALLAPAFRALPVGTPKLLVSTVASGNVAPYVGGSDITMMYSVTDVQGLNAISRRILGNAAHALAGMIEHSDRLVKAPDAGAASELPSLGLTMFGVTTPCVSALESRLNDKYECLVFHATGTGGMSMEKLCDSGMLSGIVDITTTEIADMLSGGVFAATEDRLGAVIRSGVPYVGSVGALDMVNFGAVATVPERYKDRLLHVHNPQVTLMRTTPEENIAIAEWLAAKLNAIPGEVRFLLPEKGVSMLDAEGQPFYDPVADKALFDTIDKHFKQTDTHKLIRIDANINDSAFVDALQAAVLEVM